MITVMLNTKQSLRFYNQPVIKKQLSLIIITWLSWFHGIHYEYRSQCKHYLPSVYA